MQREKDRSGLKSVLRMTPNDNREFERPPLAAPGPLLGGDAGIV